MIALRSRADAMSIDYADPLGYLQPGDLDPTVHTGTFAFCATPGPATSLVCTRVPGHVGRHIAGNGAAVAEVWAA